MLESKQGKSFRLIQSSFLIQFFFFSGSLEKDLKKGSKKLPEKGSKNEEKQSESTNKAHSSEKKPTEYAYNRKGQLVVNGYSYLRSTIRNTSIEWRCADAKKHKCNARVRTVGKTLQVVNIAHNHEPRKQKQFDAIVWSENLN